MRKYFKFAIYAIAALAFSSAGAGTYEDFFRAVNNDDARTVKEIIGRGFDPNSPDERGQVALYLALRELSPKVLAALLASPDTKVDASNAAGETPLMMAALRGHQEWAERLLERGAAVNKEGWSPLHYAATGPQVSIVGLLLDRGARIDAPSPNGTTPLMMAAQYGSEDSVLLLVKRGANLGLRNDKGINAVDFARLSGREPLTARLQALLR